MARKRNLKSFFAEYLVVMILSFVVDLVLCMFILYIAVAFEIVATQNQTENQISQRVTFIQKTKKVQKDDILKSCRYVVFRKDGTYLYGNASKEQGKEAYVMYQNDRRISNGIFMSGIGATCYYPIERKDSICSLIYTAGTQYKVKGLQEHMPPPELTILGLGGILGILEIIIISAYYGKRIGKKLVPLQSATDFIKQQNLEFEISYSGIKEVDDILDSMKELKENLKKALIQTWDVEHAKEIQISALAHDLKTPLTLVIGNAELLEDTTLSKEQLDMVAYIQKNADQLEEYIEMLNQLLHTNKGFDFHKKQVRTKSFVTDVIQQVQKMAMLKDILFVVDNVDFEMLPEVLYIDEMYLKRAIINIISNAIDYSRPNERVFFGVEYEKKNRVVFCVKDEGKGFLPEEIKHATEQFYQGDKSRTRKFHYGMGLYIAKIIANYHGGELELRNRKEKGASVCIYIVNET